MFRPLSPGYHRVTSKKYNLKKLYTVLHKNESHRLKMQRDLTTSIMDV
jgi:hypothetical protein